MHNQRKLSSRLRRPLRDSQALPERQRAALLRAYLELHAILRSLSWRMTAPVRFLLKHLLHDHRPLKQRQPQHSGSVDVPCLQSTHLDVMESEAFARAQIQLFTDAVRFAVIVLTEQENESVAPSTMTSLMQQWYRNWTVHPVLPTAKRQHADQLLEGCAASDWILFVRSGNQLLPSALYHIAAAIQRYPHVILIYADEAHWPSGERQQPQLWFKPAFDPDRLLAQAYIDGVVACRRDAVVAAGGLMPHDGSASLDGLQLRILQLQEPAAVLHIPRVLYYTSKSVDARATDRAAGDQRRAMLRRHLAASGLQVNVEPVSNAAGLSRIRYPVHKSGVKVSLIIPTRDQPTLLQRCIDSIQRYSDWPDLEVLILDNGSKEPTTCRLLRAIAATGQARVHRVPGPFNWSDLNNIGAAHAKGLVLGFFNDDIEVIEPGWLEELVSQAMRPEIGVVGPKLLYPDGRIQHAGVALVWGDAEHIHRGDPGTASGHGHCLRVVRTVTAMTGAAMVMRRAVFEALGQFDTRLPVNFNDTDFCLRARDAGYRCLFTPHVELIHHESATRNTAVSIESKARLDHDRGLFLARWGHEVGDDDYHNPNLI